MHFKSAVVGCGHIGQQHLAALAALLDTESIVVCDLSESLARASAERFNLKHWTTDFSQLLEKYQPGIVHIATPANTHVNIATQAMSSGAHVFVEKPIAPTYEQFLILRGLAEAHQRWLIEDHNYRFNPPMAKIFDLIEAGEFGDVTHADIFIGLDILGEGSVFTDTNLPHPSTREPGGAVSDFVSHLAYLTCQLVGPHQRVETIWKKTIGSHNLPADEFRAQVDGATGTANLAFSARTQPDVFAVEVYGTKMSARASLFEPGVAVRRMRKGIRPLTPLINGLVEGWGSIFDAIGSLRNKLGGAAGSYQGLRNLISRTYKAIENNGCPPVTLEQIDQTNRLVDALLEGAPKR